MFFGFRDRPRVRGLLHPPFLCLTERGRIQPMDKLLILRHDIDTDIETTRAMWRVERELGIKTSYFFRLSTVDLPLMREIEACGGSVGYHFEELATAAKPKGSRRASRSWRSCPTWRPFRTQPDRIEGPDAASPASSPLMVTSRIVGSGFRIG